MVMLTEALRFSVTDNSGRTVKLNDLCIVLLDDDYPPITHLLFLENGDLKRIDWKEVRIDERSRRLYVNDLGLAVSVDGNADVLLKRDILDALILDLLGRRTTRVCDLLLEEEDGKLRVRSADAGFAAMIRRVTNGRIGRVDEHSMFDWKYVEFLRGDPQAVDNGAGYRLRINRLPAGEIARLCDYIPYLHAAELIKLLPDEKAADVLQATSIERQLQIIEEIGEDDAINLLCLMSSDLAADLMGRLHVETMRRWLHRMPEKNRNRIIDLLRYPENTVGGVMINDIIFIGGDITAAEAKELVKDKLKEVDFGSVIFFVDDNENRRLRGSITLRQLLIVEDDKTLDEVMDPYLEVLSPHDLATNGAYKIVDGQLPAMPVVNEDGRLLGAMTIDSAIALLVPVASGLQTLRVFS
jgi:CBS domain-containing protein